MKFKIIYAVAALILFAILNGCGSDQESTVPMFSANLERTGVYPAGGPTSLNELIWKFGTGAPIFSSPAISDGVVYFGCKDNHLYAVR